MAILTKKRNVSKSRKQKNVSKSRKNVLRGGSKSSMKIAAMAAMDAMPTKKKPKRPLPSIYTGLPKPSKWSFFGRRMGLNTNATKYKKAKANFKAKESTEELKLFLKERDQKNLEMIRAENTRNQIERSKFHKVKSMSSKYLSPEYTKMHKEFEEKRTIISPPSIIPPEIEELEKQRTNNNIRATHGENASKYALKQLKLTNLNNLKISNQKMNKSLAEAKAKAEAEGITFNKNKATQNIIASHYKDYNTQRKDFLSRKIEEAEVAQYLSEEGKQSGRLSGRITRINPESYAKLNNTNRIIYLKQRFTSEWANKIYRVLNQEINEPNINTVQKQNKIQTLINQFRNTGLKQNATRKTFLNNVQKFRNAQKQATVKKSIGRAQRTNNLLKALTQYENNLPEEEPEPEIDTFGQNVSSFLDKMSHKQATGAKKSNYSDLLSYSQEN